MLLRIFAKMRFYLAIFMTILLSFQVLPVKEIGKLLAKSQFTEEIHEHGHEEEVVSKLKKQIPFTPFQLSNYRSVQVCLNNQIHTAILIACSVKHQHFPDIFVVPPNLA